MGRREENKVEKRRRIDAAGLRELLRAGYADATLERVVADADVARGTFYLYYPDKHALFVELLARFYGPLTEAVVRARDALHAGEDPPTVYMVLGAALAGVLDGDRDGARLALRESRSAGPGGDAVRVWTERLEGLTREILEDAVERGILRPHDTHAVALAIIGGVERLTWAWLDGGALEPLAVTGELIGLFTWGLAAR
jgi:AcrR family transcriptional regulator